MRRKSKKNKDKLRAFKKDKNSILQIYLDEKREADEKLRLAQERFVRNQAFAKMASNDVKTIQESLIDRIAEEESLYQKMEEKYKNKEFNTSFIEELDKSFKNLPKKNTKSIKKLQKLNLQSKKAKA